MSSPKGMACGRAVICSAAGGAAELITEGHDALGHAPGDEVGLAARMTELARSRVALAPRTSRKNYGRAAIQSGPAIGRVDTALLPRHGTFHACSIDGVACRPLYKTAQRSLNHRESRALVADAPIQFK